MQQYRRCFDQLGSADTCQALVHLRLIALLGSAMHTPVVVAELPLCTFECIFARQRFHRRVLDVDQR